MRVTVSRWLEAEEYDTVARKTGVDLGEAYFYVTRVILQGLKLLTICSSKRQGKLVGAYLRGTELFFIR